MAGLCRGGSRRHRPLLGLTAVSCSMWAPQVYADGEAVGKGTYADGEAMPTAKMGSPEGTICRGAMPRATLGIALCRRESGLCRRGPAVGQTFDSCSEQTSVCMYKTKASIPFTYANRSPGWSKYTTSRATPSRYAIGMPTITSRLQTKSTYRGRREVPIVKAADYSKLSYH